MTPLLEGEFRCVVPDLPLGSHRVPMSPDADLSPPGVARIVADFLAALDLEDVTLIGNDTGGAICQLVATAASGAARAAGADAVRRVRELPASGLPADAVRGARAGTAHGRAPAGASGRRAAQPARLRAADLPRFDRSAGDRLVARPFFSNRGVRRDAIKFLKAISNRYTLEAAERLRDFDRPALIAWAPEDRFFKLTLRRAPRRGDPRRAAGADRGLSHVRLRGPARAPRRADPGLRPRDLRSRRRPPESPT